MLKKFDILTMCLQEVTNCHMSALERRESRGNSATISEAPIRSARSSPNCVTTGVTIAITEVQHASTVGWSCMFNSRTSGETNEAC
jgi:hypothetical protein